ARAEISLAPPGGAGTTRRTGLTGKSRCASAGSIMAVRPSASMPLKKQCATEVTPITLFIDGSWARGSGGRGSRCTRLAQALDHIGHVVAKSTKYEESLTTRGNGV